MLPVIITHQNVNVNICNFPIFGPIFMKVSPKSRLGIFFTVLGSFGSIYSWEGADNRPQIRHRKIPAKSEDPDEMPHKAAFHQGLNCLQK